MVKFQNYFCAMLSSNFVRLKNLWQIKINGPKYYLDGSVERRGCEGVVVFRVDNDLHHVVSVALENLELN